MSDSATPNLPSRNFEKTSHFYRALGFSERWHDKNWMILERGTRADVPESIAICLPAYAPGICGLLLTKT